MPGDAGKYVTFPITQFDNPITDLLPLIRIIAGKRKCYFGAAHFKL